MLIFDTCYQLARVSVCLFPSFCKTSVAVPWHLQHLTFVELFAYLYFFTKSILPFLGYGAFHQE